MLVYHAQTAGTDCTQTAHRRLKLDTAGKTKPAQRPPRFRDAISQRRTLLGAVMRRLVDGFKTLKNLPQSKLGGS